MIYNKINLMKNSDSPDVDRVMSNKSFILNNMAGYSNDNTSTNQYNYISLNNNNISNTGTMAYGSGKFYKALAYDVYDSSVDTDKWGGDYAYMTESDNYFKLKEGSCGEGGTYDIVFYGNEGYKAYMVLGYEIYEYDLSIPYDYTSKTYTGNSIDVRDDDGTANGMIGGAYITPDGTKVILGLTEGGDDETDYFQYTLSTPWDLDSHSYDGQGDTDSDENLGLCFGNQSDTTGYMYAFDTFGTGDKLVRYDAVNYGVVGSLNGNQTSNDVFDGESVKDIYFKDSSTFFLLYDSDEVKVYSTSNWSIDNGDISYSSTYDFSNYLNTNFSKGALEFYNDGKLMSINGFIFDLATAGDLSTAEPRTKEVYTKELDLSTEDSASKFYYETNSSYGTKKVQLTDGTNTVNLGTLSDNESGEIEIVTDVSANTCNVWKDGTQTQTDLDINTLNNYYISFVVAYDAEITVYPIGYAKSTSYTGTIGYDNQNISAGSFIDVPIHTPQPNKTLYSTDNKNYKEKNIKIIGGANNFSSLKIKHQYDFSYSIDPSTENIESIESNVKIYYG